MAPDGTVYAAGDGGVPLQYSAGKWRKYSAAAGTIYGLGGSAAGNVMAVGASGMILHGQR